MCAYRLAGSEKPVATTGVIRRTDYAVTSVPVRRERNAKAMAYVVYRNRNPVTAPVVRRLKFVLTARVRVRKALPSTTKGNVCVRPGRCWLTTNANPSFVPSRDPTTPAPIFMAIVVVLVAMKMEVYVLPVCVKMTAPAEQFTHIMLIEITMAVRTLHSRHFALIQDPTIPTHVIFMNKTADVAYIAL